MKLSRTARALLSVTALAWSIPFAQATEARIDVDETVCASAGQAPGSGEASVAPGAAVGESQRDPAEPDDGRA